MRQLFVQNTGAIDVQAGDPDDPSDITAGKLAVFSVGNPSEVYDILPITALAMPDKFMLVQGGAPPLLSHIIDKTKVFDIKKQDYVAPVALVLTATMVAAVDAGTSSATVIDRTTGHLPFPRFSADVATLAAATAASIATALAAALNAVPNKTYTATTSTADLIITANEVGTNLVLAFDGPGSPATAIVTTAFNFGQGTPNQVRAIEQAAFGNLGEYYVQDGLLGQFPRRTSSVDDASTYDLYTFQVQPDKEDSVNRHYTIEIIIAVHSAVTGDLDAFFGL